MEEGSGRLKRDGGVKERSRRWGVVKWTVIALLSLTVAGGGWFVWNRWFSARANPSPVEYPVRGIDISAHNGSVDFSRVKASGIDYIYVKATEGTDFMDRNYDRNARGATSCNIPCGAYHFFRFDTDGEMQALNFLSALRRRGFTLPPAIDVEEWGNPKGETDTVVARLRSMVDYMVKSGQPPLIYTNKDGYQRFIRGRFDECPLWICSFTDPPLEGVDASAITVWQYSHRGSVDGISGAVDLNASRAIPGQTIPGLED